MSKGALAFMVGLGTGYLNASKEDDDKKRREKLDQITFDRADREKKAADREESIRTGIAGAAKNEEVNNDAQVVSGIAAKPAIYENSDLASSDVREASRMLRAAPAPIAAQGIIPKQDVTQVSASTDAIGATPQQVSPQEPIAAQGISMAAVGRPMFKGKEYADSAAAQAAADGYNSAESRNSRIAQVYRANGDHLGAMDLENKSMSAEATKLQLTQTKELEARNVFGRGMVNAYSTGGSASLMSFLSNSHADGEKGAVKFDQQLSQDGKTATIFKTDANGGRIKVGDIENTENGWQGAMFKLQKGLDPSALFAHASEVKKQERIVAQDKLDQANKDREHAERVRANKVSEGISYAGLNLNIKKFEADTPEGKIKSITKVLGEDLPLDERKRMLGVDSLPQATRLLVNSNLKEQEQLTQSMNKAMAEGSWQPNSEGAKALTERAVVLQLNLQKILPRKSEKNPPQDDPLGVFATKKPEKNDVPANIANGGIKGIPSPEKAPVNVVGRNGILGAPTPVSKREVSNDYELNKKAALERINKIENDPELNALLKEKSAHMKSGKAVAANNAMDKYNDLKIKRYGQ